MRFRPSLVGGGVVVGIVSALLACSETFPARVRERTYPPSFQYLSTQELHSAMGQLAAHADRLDERMRAHERGEAISQPEVVGLLRAMERIGASLGPGDWPTNHPRVSRNIEQFRRELEAARRAAEADPPSYYRAGVVTGACSLCHRDG